MVINFGGIGDEILFLPVLKAIRDTYAESKITLCLEGRSGAFLKLTNIPDKHFFADIKTKNKYIINIRVRSLTG